MTPLNRYLRCFRDAVPSARRTEALAEVRDAINEHLKRESDSLGRPLNDEETRAALRRFGSPWEVAALYWDRSTFIPGPLLRPYAQTITFSLIAAAIIHGTLIGHRMIVTGSVGDAISQSIPGLLLAVAAIVVVPALVFALLGHNIPRSNPTV